MKVEFLEAAKIDLVDRTNRFPYGIVYSLEPETILVVAVMHDRRHPDTWRRRT